MEGRGPLGRRNKEGVQKESREDGSERKIEREALDFGVVKERGRDEIEITIDEKNYRLVSQIMFLVLNALKLYMACSVC